MGNRGIFDEDIRLAKLSELGDSLVKLNRVINWEMFRPLLEKATHKEKKGVGGRPPFDCVLMFKVLEDTRRRKLLHGRIWKML